MCSIRAEGSSFYSRWRWPWGGARVAVVVDVPRSRRGKAWVRRVPGALVVMTRFQERPGVVWLRRHRHLVPGYSGGWSPSVSSSTGLARPSGVVWELCEVTGVVQVQGEREGRREATGPGDALARPEASWRASMPILAGAGRVLGACGLGSVDVSSSQQVYGRGQ